MKYLLILLALFSAPATAMTCLGEAGIICEAATTNTELTIAPVAIANVSADLAPGYTVHITLSGPATFGDLPSAGLLAATDTSAVYATSPIAGITVRLSDAAYIGDTVGLRVEVVDPNKAVTIEASAFDAVRVIGFSHITLPTFNPGRNPNQQGLLRLVNPTGSECGIRIVGTDDAGNESGPVELWLDKHQATQVTSASLEQGGMGQPVGKWRLTVDADCPGLIAQSLIRNASGTVTNVTGSAE